MSAIRRLYVRKKEGFRQGEESLTSQLNEVLGNRLAETAVYHRYDVDGLTEEDYEKAVATVFSEPPVDSVEEALPKGDLVIGVEFLPGQYDQRADSAEQCLAIVTGKDGARVRCALVYTFNGDFIEGQFDDNGDFIEGQWITEVDENGKSEQTFHPAKPKAKAPAKNAKKK